MTRTEFEHKTAEILLKLKTREKLQSFPWFVNLLIKLESSIKNN